MTISPLVKNYQDAVNAAAAKKAYSEVVNVYNLYLADNGGTVNGTFTTWFNLKDKLKGYFKYVRAPNSGRTIKPLRVGGTAYNTYTGIYRTDGIYIGIGNTSNTCALMDNVCGWVFIDVNGNKCPNTIGYDVFIVFLMSDKALPYSPGWGTDHYANQACIEPGHAGSADWTNIGTGCLMRILQNKPKWSG